MRIAYFDCFSGISGDMALGAFLDAGLDPKVLKRELGKLGLAGCEIKITRTKRGGLAGTKFNCAIAKGRGHQRGHATLKSILNLIEKSRLGKKVKDLASRIFLTLGRAEAKVHDLRLGNVHFHEVGNIDSIVDIAGVAIAAVESGVEKFYSSRLRLGRGYVATRSGKLPIPGPAAMEILKGAPLEETDVEAELVTPTGAAILKTLCMEFGPMPSMRIEQIGYGAGGMELDEVPNMLRVVFGQSAEGYSSDSIVVLETNTDDMSPLVFGYLFDRLFKAGALDVWITPIQMKKSRPAFQLSVLVGEALKERIAAIIFEETQAIGLRYYKADRLKLDRRIEKVSTKYGQIKVKISSGPSGHAGAKTISPEYDDCAAIARKRRVPFKVVYDEAKRKAA